MSAIDTTTSKPVPSPRLRAWLIGLTIVASLAFAFGILGTVLSAAMVAGFGGDDPSTTVDQVMGMIGAVLMVGIVYLLLLIAGVVGGWIAYRKRRNRLAFWLSLLAALPIALVILAIAALFIFNSIETARIMRQY